MNETALNDHWKDLGFTTDLGIDSEFIKPYSNYFEKFSSQLRTSLRSENASVYSQPYKKFNDEGFLTYPIDINIPKRMFTPTLKKDTYTQSFTKLKGYVTGIYDDYFEARLYDLLDNGTYEEGQFDIFDVDQYDMDLFSIGSIFYWTFGYFKIKGQVKKQSEIRFQRIAPLELKEVDKIIDKAKDLNDSLIWD